jgi:hypothetical protein
MEDVKATVVKEMQEDFVKNKAKIKEEFEKNTAEMNQRINELQTGTLIYSRSTIVAYNKCSVVV